MSSYCYLGKADVDVRNKPAPEFRPMRAFFLSVLEKCSNAIDLAALDGSGVLAFHSVKPRLGDWPKIVDKLCGEQEHFFDAAKRQRLT